MDFIIGGLIVIIVLIAIIVIALISTSFSKHTTNSHPQEDEKSLEDLKGLEGEKIVRQKIGAVLESNEYLLTNILISNSNGNTTEIDAVLITHKGVFCIEIKNWIGRINGDNFSEYWIQEYNDSIYPMKQHRNPYMQNERHCEILDNLFNNSYRFRNIVLFVKLDDRSLLFSTSTFDISNFLQFYKNLPTNHLSNYDLELIVDKLRPYVASDSDLKAHKERIKNKYTKD